MKFSLKNSRRLEKISWFIHRFGDTANSVPGGAPSLNDSGKLVGRSLEVERHDLMLTDILPSDVKTQPVFVQVMLILSSQLVRL